MAKRTVDPHVIGTLPGSKMSSGEVASPEANEFICEILEKALNNQQGVAKRWEATAWALLANALVSKRLHGWDEPREADLAKAEGAAQRAIDLEPDLAIGHHAKGLVLRAKGEHQQALTEFETALTLSPDFARAYAQKANELVQLGRYDEALPFIQKAIELGSHDPSLGMFYWITARAYFYSGKYPDAIPWLEKSIALRPNVWYNRLYLVSAHARAGNNDIAKRVLDEFTLKFGQYTVERVMAHEKANPIPDSAGRRDFHRGLGDAGMPAH